jgi:uncharacterized protein YbjT (DUF2867 family)
LILIIGATGTTGSEVARQLSTRNVPFRVLARDPQKVRDLGLQGEVVQGDLSRPETLDAAFEGVERVYIATSAPDGQLATLEINAIEAAKKAGARHVVKLSALGVSADGPLAILGAPHWQVEQHLVASGLDYTLLKPTSFMQNYLNLDGETIRNQGAFYAPVGDGRVPLIDVRDIAEVAVVALTSDGHAGKTYTLTGPTANTYTEYAEKLSAAVGREIHFVDVPPQAFKETLLGFGIPEVYADGLGQLFALYASGQAEDVAPGVSEALGRAPRTFEAFARDHADAFKVAQPV